jgi:mycothiol synthase
MKTPEIPMEFDTQLQMVWTDFSRTLPISLPNGYTLRTYRRGDEPGFYRVMEAAGFKAWDDARLRPWIGRILPESWFMVTHDDPDNASKNGIVATAMGVHDHSDQHPFGGELGWVAADPDHHGKGLGYAACAAVTNRLIGMGYRNIHLYTEDFRLPAIRLYLNMGYVPFVYSPQMEERWRVLCEKLNWQYTPEQWRRD